MLIRFTKDVEYIDLETNTLHKFKVGDTLTAVGAAEDYWLTSIGGVWFDEVELIKEN
jgi:hypothetical protein